MTEPTPQPAPGSDAPLAMLPEEPTAAVPPDTYDFDDDEVVEATEDAPEPKKRRKRRPALRMPPAETAGWKMLLRGLAVVLAGWALLLLLVIVVNAEGVYHRARAIGFLNALLTAEQGTGLTLPGSGEGLSGFSRQAFASGLRAYGAWLLLLAEVVALVGYLWCWAAQPSRVARALLAVLIVLVAVKLIVLMSGSGVPGFSWLQPALRRFTGGAIGALLLLDLARAVVFLMFLSRVSDQLGEHGVGRDAAGIITSGVVLLIVFAVFRLIVLGVVSTGVPISKAVFRNVFVNGQPVGEQLVSFELGAVGTFWCLFVIVLLLADIALHLAVLYPFFRFVLFLHTTRKVIDSHLPA